MSVTWEIVNLMCKLMQVCGAGILPFVPVAIQQWGRVTEIEEVKCLLSFCLRSPILKTTIWNGYSVAYFSLKDKNNKNTESSDNKHEQHPALTNYMKRKIVLVNETLISHVFLSSSSERGGRGQRSAFTKSNGSDFDINSESRFSVTAPQRGRLLPDSIVL